MNGYQRHRRESQRRYRRKGGKLKHREAEKRRRWRLWEKKTPLPPLPPLTSGGYQKVSSKEIMKFITRAVSEKSGPGKIAHCCFCGAEGVVIEKFPRRGYGKATNYNKGFDIVFALRE